MSLRGLALPDFAVTDLLDILLVTLIIYRILLLIRGTRAVQMAFGMLFLFAAYYLAQHFDLSTVRWLFGNFFTYIIFAIIVLFQAEIRRALASLARNPLSFSSSFDEQADTVETITMALSTLSSNRIGALIVLEQEMGLKNYIEGGIRIGAHISYDLLISIFTPRTPLHDGAVVIQGDRVAAAGVFLPITQNPRLGKEHGSRHRAAIGITEETDAVALVVSEETGSISVATHGEINRGLELSEVTRRLLGIVEPGRKKRSFGLLRWMNS